MGLEIHKLQDELWAQMLPLSAGDTFFIPDVFVDNLVTPERINDIVDEYAKSQPSWPRLSDSAQLKRYILTNAKKIFCILVSISNIGPTESVMRFGLTDAQLPLSSMDIKRLLHDRSRVNQFKAQQPAYSIPIFGRLWEIPEITTGLPFRTDEAIGSGTFSRVFKVKIYVIHTTVRTAEGFSWDEDAEGEKSKVVVAVRKEFNLRGSVGGMFREETRVLQYLATLRHPHIVEYLGSYLYKGVYNILFSFAEMDLGSVFRGITPSSGFEMHKNFHNSILGLSSALDSIHNYTSEDSGLQAVGYHHDIKPTNILIKGGNFVLADFGLAGLKFDTDNTETQVKFNHGTYSAPESTDNLAQVGRSIDIWAFGCVLAEVATYMLLGPVGVQEFKEARSTQVAREAWHGGLKKVRLTQFLPQNEQDKFYIDGGVKSEVSDWISMLCDSIADLVEDTEADPYSRSNMQHLLRVVEEILVPMHIRPNAKSLLSRLSQYPGVMQLPITALLGHIPNAKKPKL